MRLCKTMGFKGYQDLKLKVAGDLQEPLATGYQDIRPNDSISAIIQNVSNNNIQSIRDTMKIMEEGKVEEAVLALDQSKRIFMFGVGASNLIGMDAQQKFCGLIRYAYLSGPSCSAHLGGALLTPDDAAVCISYSVKRMK